MVIQYDMALSSVRTELDELVIRSGNASAFTTGILPDAVFPENLSIAGNVTANTIYANMEGEVIFVGGLSVDDIIVGGTSVVDEIQAIKNTDLSSFTVQDGSVTAPSLAFQSDPNTGVFRPATDTIALTAGGATALTANATTVVVPGTVSATDVLVNGASATTLQTDMWHQSTDGEDRVYYASNGSTLFDGNVHAPIFIGDGRYLSNVASSNASTLSTGTLENARLPQDITISGDLTANTISGNLDLTNQTVDGELVLVDGHLTTTTLSADDITLAGTSLVAEIQAIKNTDLSSFTVQDGSAAAPSLAFQSDRNTGVFRPATDTIALTAGGATALSANATTVTIPGTVSATDVLVNGHSATTLRTDTWLQSSDGEDRVYYASNGSTLFDGNVHAPIFIGDGRYLSNVASSNASTLTSGTLSNNVLPQDITISGNLTANTISGNIDFSNQTVDGELVLLDGHLDTTTLAADDITLAGESLVAKLAELESRLAALE
jgi:negative regulator of replication initiation